MKPYYADESVTLYHGDALDVARTLPDGSADCIVTSPPYFSLRDYGVEGQYGLEESPGEYVETMRALFAELRRVLANDGTCWINLGDNYSSKPSWGRGVTSQFDRRSVRHAQVGVGASVDDYGVPPKNLLGIPWMVARAMQQPQYIGAIRNESDRVWLAAMIDAEGCIAIHRRMDERRTNPTFGPHVQVSNTCLAVVERCKEIAGCGSITHSDRGRNRRIYRWIAMSNDARRVLREVYPHLVAKPLQARAAVASPSSGSDAERAWLEIKALNQGGSVDGSWPVPQSMFDPGWVLRNAVIWSKPNAMPESVTDRLSNRYEHVFMFSKSRSYWFDLDAIREEYAPAGLARRAYAFRATDNYGKNPVNDGGLMPANENGRNPGNVWTIPTQPFADAHFACMPPALAERCILAGGKPGGVVLDPFSGSGTTGLAATKHGRRYVGIDLNAEYLDLSLRTRLAQTALTDGVGA